jgi:hypothetical protein
VFELDFKTAHHIETFISAVGMVCIQISWMIDTMRVRSKIK